MNESRSACQPEWLGQFWEDNLAAEQITALEQHLSVCELCQSRFDEHLSRQPVASLLEDTRSELQVGSSNFDRSGSRLRLHRSAPSLPPTGYEQSDSSHAEIGSEQHDKQRDEQHAGLCALAGRLFPVPPDHPHLQDAADARGQRPEAGKLLGAVEHFDLLEPIGSGGMGFVYKAYDRRLQRLVALKVLSPSVATVGAARQRFLREARAAATIVSPHVVPIHAVAQVDGLPYLVMSLIDGPDLQHWILHHGPLSMASSLRIAQQIATGLEAAHGQGIVHRDVKPANILLQPSIMQAALTDFGLAMVTDDASLTHSGLTAGTPSFMSPEQARGDAIDARSDWYSLGCVLYTMLIGHPPFRGSHAMAVLTRLQGEEPKPPSYYRGEIPPWLDRLVLRLLTRDVDQRLTDSTVIISTLAGCVQHLDNPSRHELPLLLQQPRRRRAAWRAAVGLCFLALGGWTGWVAWRPSRLNQSERPAHRSADGESLTQSQSSASVAPPNRDSQSPPTDSDPQSVKQQVITAEVHLRRSELLRAEEVVAETIEQLERELWEIESQSD